MLWVLMFVVMGLACAEFSEEEKNEIKDFCQDMFWDKELRVNEKLQIQYDRLREKDEQFDDELLGLKQAINGKEVPEKNQVAFSVHLSGDEYYGKDEPIPFTGVRTNRGGHYSTYTHMFTCPLDGVYYFSYSIYSGWIKDDTDYIKSSASLYLEGSVMATVYSRESDPSHSSQHQGGTSVVLECQAQQRVWLQNRYDNNKIHGDSGAPTVFSGFLLYAL